MSKCVMGGGTEWRILGRTWQSHASTSDTALPRSLPDLSGTRGRQDCTQAYHPRHCWARGQADLVHLQVVSDNGHKFIINYKSQQVSHPPTTQGKDSN